MVSERIPFAKMSGSGNDFVVVDNRAGVIPAASVAEFARLVCRRGIAVGADGVVLIESPVAPGEPAPHFRWRYVNADGTDGEMCGNGAMCGARFAFLQGTAPAQCAFQTASGIVHAEVDGDGSSPIVRLKMVDPSIVRVNLALEASGPLRNVHCVTVGVPHAVVLTEDVVSFAPGEAFLAMGRAVRYHHRFAPEGTNFDAIEVRDRHRLQMRTYERGVEDETLACGTGAVAGAVVAARLGLVESPVEVVTKSRRVLGVDFAWDGSHATGVTLSGEARVVASGEIWPEALA
ncbi:MAG TPA: diaminopimelate epimerase [Thermomicrobiales bacterium]|jgi:diaminopimelate epimerase